MGKMGNMRVILAKLKFDVQESGEGEDEAHN
jgi:hypothetical protein